MRAFAVMERGAAPVVVDVPDVQPAAGQIRVAVHAASINGVDAAVAGGYVWDYLPHTFPVVLGKDFAGTVDAVGSGVTDVHVGDDVTGVNTASSLGPGSIGEFLTVDAASVTRLPSGVTFEQAAAVGLAGVTAWDAVEAMAVTDIDMVLVSGATGGVGSYAVQLAHARGARVIATARAGAATEFARSLGAQEVVDHTGDLTAAVREVAPDGVTKVLHTAGDVAALAALLTPGGQLASLIGATAEQAARDDITVTPVMGAFTPEKLATLLAQVNAGGLTVPVAATYELADAAAALTRFASGKLGKIVVRVR
ncbi:MAG: Alcohol dehydrogenase GroES domain protein [Frankiales bacterium]|nr:Alcohol dehydrogenase GroES domain protein [Frankiales bacterium]